MPVRRSAGIRVCLTVCLFAAVLLGARPAAAQAAAGETASRILVMPFDNAAREPRGYWLGEGSAVTLTDSLLALGLPVMDRDERLRSFDLLRVPAVGGLSQATVIRVAQAVGASQVVVGSFTLAGNDVTVRARSILLDTGQIGAEQVETGPLQEIFLVYDRLARRLVPDAPAVAAPAHPPVKAFEQYVKGLLAETPASRLTFLREATRMAPALHQARIAAWHAHNDLGANEQALEAVREVPPDDPLGRKARFLGGISLLQMTRHAEAFAAFAGLNGELPDAALLNNMGVVQLRRPDDTSAGRAVSYFNEAAGLGAADAFFNLGYAYWRDGDATAAAHWLREAVRRDPTDHAAHYVLGVALAATGNPEEAARERDLARRLSSTYAEWEAQARGEPVPRGLERVRMDLDVPPALQVENAIAAASQRDHQQIAAFHLAAGVRAFEDGRDADAIAELRRATYLSPYDHEAHLLLGRIYLRTGRVPDAISELRIALWSGDTVPVRLALAEAYAASGGEDEARAELQQVLEIDPANAAAAAHLERLDAR